MTILGEITWNTLSAVGHLTDEPHSRCGAGIRRASVMVALVDTTEGDRVAKDSEGCSDRDGDTGGDGVSG